MRSSNADAIVALEAVTGTAYVFPSSLAWVGPPQAHPVHGVTVLPVAFIEGGVFFVTDTTTNRHRLGVGHG